VNKAFEQGVLQGTYAEIAREVVRPSSAERSANPRSAPAKLRWARKAAAPSGEATVRLHQAAAVGKD